MNFLGIGPGELVLILVIAVIVLGPDKIPETMRTIGKAMREIRTITEGFQKELNKELAEVTKEPAAQPAPTPPKTQIADPSAGDRSVQTPVAVNAELPPPYGPAVTPGSDVAVEPATSDENSPDDPGEAPAAEEVNPPVVEPTSEEPSVPLNGDRA